MSKPEIPPRQSRPHNREEIIAAYKSSGLSQSQFSRKSGVALSTLSKWLQRSSTKATAPSFMPLSVTEGSQCASPAPARIAAPLELYYRDDWHLVLPAEFDAASLARVVAVLGEHYVPRR